MQPPAFSARACGDMQTIGAYRTPFAKGSVRGCVKLYMKLNWKFYGEDRVHIFYSVGSKGTRIAP